MVGMRGQRRRAGVRFLPAMVVLAGWRGAVVRWSAGEWVRGDGQGWGELIGNCGGWSGGVVVDDGR